VELPVGGDQPGAAPQVERGQEAQHQVVRAGAERELRVRVAEEAAQPVPDPVGLLERQRPLAVGVPGRVHERVDLPGQRHVRPGLVGVAGEQQPLGDAEAGVVRREPRGLVHHIALLTAHRSGKQGASELMR
jgi:hypothetical protein